MRRVTSPSVSARRRLNLTELAAKIDALDPLAQAMVEDEVERLVELQREAQRLGRDPSERLN